MLGSHKYVDMIRHHTGRIKFISLAMKMFLIALKE